MEESDNMLIQTLKEQIEIPASVSSLSDIRAQQLFSISIKVLQNFKIDISEILSMASRQQKFRSMAKLNQCLQGTLQASFEMNQLMNPSVSFLRKFLLMIINKLGYGDVEKSKMLQKESTTQTFKQQKIQLKQWLSQEWIHPSLKGKRQKYKGYILPISINKNVLKNNVNLTNELNNPQLEGNSQTSLNISCAKLNQRVKEFQANQGFSRKEYEQGNIRLQNIIRINKDDWLINYNKLHKIKKKLIEQKPDNQSSIIAPEVPSVFKQELEVAENQAEKKKQESIQLVTETITNSTEDEVTLSPLELLKREAETKKHRYQNEIRQILNQLQQKKEAVESWQGQKEQIQEKMIADEQKMTKLKQSTLELKKHVQKRQTILAALEGQKNIEEQITKLEQEIQLIQTQAGEEVKKLEIQIKEIKNDSKQKMEALNDLKAKLTKIESEYSKICEEIAEKQELKTNVKIMKSNIPRAYYHKKISEMESRWRQQQKETKKLKTSLQQLREKTRISSTLSGRVQTQIENIINSQKSKRQEQNRMLKELIGKCKLTYQNTMKTLEEVNEVKMQTQEYEVKVHTLSGKNFKQNIERIEMAMSDLKREMGELTKTKIK